MKAGCLRLCLAKSQYTFQLDSAIQEKRVYYFLESKREIAKDEPKEKEILGRNDRIGVPSGRK